MASVLILGAASDMAIALADQYASKGYNLILAARNSGRLSTISSDIKIKWNVTCDLYDFDALDFKSHKEFFSSLKEKPEITICVFGYLGDQEKGMEDWKESERIIHSNYTGAVSILNIIASNYAEIKSGFIVGISSVAGERGRQSNFLYGSAKAGFTAYLSGLRNSMFHKNVHVLTVLPGFVYTSMTEHLKLPPLLTAKPEDVALSIYNGVRKKKNVIYVKWFWRWIMLIIKMVPEFVFKKMKL